MRRLTARERVFPLAGEFKISRGSRTESRVVEVEIATDGITARGESFPYPRYGESIASVIAQIESLSGAVADGLTRAELQPLLPAGAARNAVDCALWDLEAKQTGKRVWELAGLAAPPVLTTAYTLSLDTPAAMGSAAAAQAARPVLKLKLAGDGQDEARVAAVRAASPAAMLIVDANEGASASEVEALCHALAKHGVAMIEQPVSAGDDSCLAGFEHPVPLCADEAFHTLADFDKVQGKYEFINIKLDKTGGLTEALAVAAEARRRGFRIMTGCMVGSSLAMAPATLPAAVSEIVDIDGPLLMAKDREGGLVYRGSLVEPPSRKLWG
jgi:L-Ala-D/L-Glu epimerase